MFRWNFSIILNYKYALLMGLWWTIKLNFFVVVIGTILGVLIAFARLSSWKFISGAAMVYIEILRALPVLVFLIWFHYVFPSLTGITPGALLDAIIVLSLNLAAIVADIVRSGLESIPMGQIDAAKALGMTKTQIIYRITLPVAIRRMTPSLVSQYVNTIKLSALAFVIGVPELLHTASDLITITYRPLEFYSVVAALFLMIILPLTWFSKKLEMRANI